MVIHPVRGQSTLLKSTIEEDMPSLAVDILSASATSSERGSERGEGGDNGAVLQGQISHWTLRITNCGTAPACNVTLKTNVPWINVCSSRKETESRLFETEGEREDCAFEQRATSHCIGPSGTLMSLPLTMSPEAEIVDGIIHPGECIDIPVLVRTSGGGRQEFYMLFRYELWRGGQEVSAQPLPNTSNLKPKFRWLRKMISVPVYPSLTMTASLMPSFWKKSEHVLSVEVSKCMLRIIHNIALLVFNPASLNSNPVTTMLFCSFHR